MTRVALLLAVAWTGLGLPARAQDSTATHWCAQPRPQEPLLRDARGLIAPADSAWARRRHVFRIPLIPDGKIVVIRDDRACREHAKAYGDKMRRVQDPSWADRPVLVVQVGGLFLVDDVRSRDGEYPSWKAILFDAKGRQLLEYGAGS